MDRGYTVYPGKLSWKQSSLRETQDRKCMRRSRRKSQLFFYKYDPACSTTPIDCWGHPVKDPEEMSGSERSEAKSS
ncbi:hypothetical protein EVAR_43635_1 [Eumeta japonica]|uniref:Uncharacterized protein n=1 Tax=Eumeta variegata TaxID=151549 RepID=A0A4C1XHK8_EUMVA|nr:hypothetical protein EVAR_43635_1 [Eumeta japonica]